MVSFIKKFKAKQHESMMLEARREVTLGSEWGSGRAFGDDGHVLFLDLFTS